MTLPPATLPSVPRDQWAADVACRVTGAAGLMRLMTLWTTSPDPPPRLTRAALAQAYALLGVAASHLDTDARSFVLAARQRFHAHLDAVASASNLLPSSALLRVAAIPYLRDLHPGHGPPDPLPLCVHLSGVYLLWLDLDRLAMPDVLVACQHLPPR